MLQKKIRKFHKAMVLIIPTGELENHGPVYYPVTVSEKLYPCPVKAPRGMSTLVLKIPKSQMGSIQQKRVQCFVASMKWLVMVKGSS